MLAVENLGTLPYAEAHAIQIQRVAQRVAEEIPDTLLLLEHPPVITLGRGTDPRHVVAPGDIPVVPCERGGDVTLHAPGQIVGYVIRRLPRHGRDVHDHLRRLEEVILRALATFRLDGRRLAGRTGVWVAERKIASLGVACRRWCTWHGFALNVDLDLSLFQRIQPCGFHPDIMTSLAAEGVATSATAVRDLLADCAREVFCDVSVDGPGTET